VHGPSRAFLQRGPGCAPLSVRAWVTSPCTLEIVVSSLEGKSGFDDNVRDPRPEADFRRLLEVARVLPTHFETDVAGVEPASDMARSLPESNGFTGAVWMKCAAGSVPVLALGPMPCAS
jgi:hypothetical protein